MDGTRDHQVKWNKSNSEGQEFYVFFHMRKLERKKEKECEGGYPKN